jgi:hypothetical protein
MMIISRKQHFVSNFFTQWIESISASIQDFTFQLLLWAISRTSDFLKTGVASATKLRRKIDRVRGCEGEQKQTRVNTHA